MDREFLKAVEQECLPLLLNKPAKERNKIRSRIRYCETEKELQEILNEIGSIPLEELEKIINKKENIEKEQKKEKTYPPKTIEEVHEIINKWLYIPNNEDVDIILAAALDRKVIGEPLWLFIVAPPGNTKTEIIRNLSDGSMFYQLSTLTANSFISGYIKPNGEKVKDLAEQLNGKVLVIKDFTSILSMNRDKRDEIIGQLRDAYDGYLSRKLGNIDEKITHKTNFGLIAAVTPALDKYNKVIGQLGERFLRLRFDYDDDELLDKTEINEGKEEEMRQEVSEAVMGLLTNIEIRKISFTKEDIKYMKELAKFLAKMRTPVSVKWEGDELVLDINPQSEKPGRIYKQLKKLAIGLASIKRKDNLSEETKKCLLRVIEDSCPPDRLMVWKYLKDDVKREQDIIEDLRIPRPTCQRLLNSMWRIKLLDTYKSDRQENIWKKSDKWNISSIYFGGQCPPKETDTVDIPNK